MDLALNNLHGWYAIKMEVHSAVGKYTNMKKQDGVIFSWIICKILLYENIRDEFVEKKGFIHIFESM